MRAATPRIGSEPAGSGSGSSVVAGVDGVEALEDGAGWGAGALAAETPPLEAAKEAGLGGVEAGGADAGAWLVAPEPEPGL